jgi:hypothetical protein
MRNHHGNSKIIHVWQLKLSDNSQNLLLNFYQSRFYNCMNYFHGIILIKHVNFVFNYYLVTNCFVNYESGIFQKSA